MAVTGSWCSEARSLLLAAGKVFAQGASYIAGLWPLAVFGGLFLTRPPTRLGFLFGHRFTWALAAASLLLFAAFRSDGGRSRATSLAIVLTLLALPLLSYWRSGRSDGTVIGGLLPFNDADGYYTCARRLAEGYDLGDSAYCSRRPLFVTYLGGLLAITGHNLRATLALMVLVTGAAIHTAALELRRTHGPAAATGLVVVLYAFYRWYVATVLTEHLGLALGVLGFALVWRGVHSRRVNVFAFGTFILTFALNARAGAMLTVPALVAWSGWGLRGGGSFSWVAVSRTAGAAALAFALGAAPAWMLAQPKGLFGNFSYTLYGLVTGGDWTSVRREHPELAALSEADRVREIYTLAGTAFRDHPWRALDTAGRAWREFLLTPYTFSFVHQPSINAAFRLLSVLGLVLCWRRRAAAPASLLLALTLGLVASVPFAPPWDVSWMRAYAATMGISATLPALALALLPGQGPGSTTSGGLRLPILAAVVAAFPLVAPAALRALVRPEVWVRSSFDDCADRVRFRVPDGSSIRVVANRSEGDAAAFELRQSDFRRELGELTAYYPGLGNPLAKAKAPFTLLSVIALDDLRQAYVIAPTPDLESARRSGEIVEACLEAAADERARRFGLFHALSLRPVVSKP